MARETGSPRNPIHLSLTARRPLPPTPALRKQWADLIRVAGDQEAVPIIFMSLLLGLLDNDPSPRFSHAACSRRDMFGGCDNDWTITTRRLSLHRRITQDINESWQSVKVEADLVEILGLPEGLSLDWKPESAAGRAGRRILAPRPTLVHPWTSHFGQRSTANFAAQLPASRTPWPRAAPRLFPLPGHSPSSLPLLNLRRAQKNNYSIKDDY